MREKEGYNKDSYVIINEHINCTKDTYNFFQKTIAFPINNDLKYLMHEKYCLYFKWNKDGKLDISYIKKKEIIRYKVMYQLYLFQQEFQFQVT